MIDPPNYYDGMTFDEAVAGYLEDGFSQDDAEVYARVLVEPWAEGVPII